MILILAYHSISDIDYQYAVSQKKFRKQLLYLKKRFNFISVGELYDLLIDKKMINGDFAVVTFDDGLEDNYTQAWPVLRELSIPATIFITTSLVGKSIVNSSHYKFNFMTWEQICELASSGLVAIGSHTDTHPVLTNIPLNQVESEFIRASEKITSQISQDIISFAYPKGAFNDSVKSLAKKYFKISFGGNGMIFTNNNLDLMAVPRIIVYNESDFKFRLRINRFYSKLSKLRRLISE